MTFARMLVPGLAALCALGELGVDGDAQARVRTELANAGVNDG